MNLQLVILRILDDASPRQLKRTVLEAETSLAVDGMTSSDFDRALSALDSKRQVRIYTGEDVTRIAITDDGRDRVAATK